MCLIGKPKRSTSANKKIYALEKEVKRLNLAIMYYKTLQQTKAQESLLIKI